jgi:hypothetical protein
MRFGRMHSCTKFNNERFTLVVGVNLRPSVVVILYDNNSKEGEDDWIVLHVKNHELITNGNLSEEENECYLTIKKEMEAIRNSENSFPNISRRSILRIAKIFNIPIDKQRVFDIMFNIRRED